MAIPNLKRVTISSEMELRVWLANSPIHAQSIMLVTHNTSAPDKHVSAEQIMDAIAAHGWASGARYTLNAHLVGHVIHRR
jgi:hypothetical protein